MGSVENSDQLESLNNQLKEQTKNVSFILSNP